MDCLQCVRSRQWVGAVPLGLVMGGDPPPRPDTEEEEESLTARLSWPHRLRPQRSMPGGLANATPAEVIPAVGSASPGLLAPEQASVVLTEGVAKGGYPVDISAQTTMDLATVVQSEPAAGSGALTQQATEPAADGVASLSEPLAVDQEPPPSISEVIRPMEMAELVDILPTLSLIEEEALAGAAPPSPSVMDMLESFGLGIGEDSVFFSLDRLELTNGEADAPQSGRRPEEGFWEGRTPPDATPGAGASRVPPGGNTPPPAAGRGKPGAVLGRGGQVEWVRSSEERS